MKRILIIAGSDSGGGAGIQADIKTTAALGGYAMTAITAITAQNTLGVQAVHPLPPTLVTQQIESCLSDIGADVIKIGMLANADIIDAVQSTLKTTSIPIILDPVMVATSGDALLDNTALEALKRLMNHASVITPNIPEAELLCGFEVNSQSAMLAAAGDEIHDLLLQEGEPFWFSSPRIHSKHTHGTGCTLATAIATYGAQGNALPFALEKARDYVRAAIASAPKFGAGHGPLNHSGAATTS
jgi:hydroxymethylpyrimidine/phosphomethylpyrimidine kinase